MSNILFSYDFQVVALGTMILAMSSAVVGCFSVYKGQSLIGDAIGHSTFPGIILAFMFFQSKNPILLTIGAIISGGLAYKIIQLIESNSKIKLDAALAIVLTGFFGFGLALKSYIQGHPQYSNISQSGLKGYIFGVAAFITKADVLIIAIFSIFVLVLVFIFYEELVISTFDKNYAKTIGINNKIVDLILLIMMITLISLGLKSVGAILISSFLLIPCICANQYSKNIKNVLFISMFVGAISSFLGSYFSSAIKGFSTGPMIILFMCFFTIFSMLFGKYGIFKRFIKL